ncbi:MAG: TolC family protein [Gemmatimonadetes bacterium]|nr:TolC family protein [Gemmatimonadota bacterium]
MREATRLLVLGAALLIAAPTGASAQSLTRAQAIESALARGPRRALAAADTLAAAAQYRVARTFPNPTLTTEFTKDAPQYHVLVDLPLDLGTFRSARVRSAAAARESSRLRFVYERASIAFDADVTYTKALAARERARISRLNAAAADSLRQIASTRRDAGDASDLDVEVASVNAGQQANAAAADALSVAVALLDLQVLVGVAAESSTVTLSDPLEPLPDAALPVGTGVPLLVDAAAASLTASEYALRQQKRGTWLWPTLTAGFETHDPGGATGALPVVGLSLPLPLLDRNRGPILAATAERDRAAAALALARLEAQSGIVRAARERTAATARLARDRTLLASADRIAAMSLRAYEEGAAPLATVLEAQRAAREILLQYVDDVAAARIAAATVSLVTLTAGIRP